MSLVGTLAKVAIGVAAAKGLSHVFAQSGRPGSMNMADAGGGPLGSGQAGGHSQPSGGLGSLLEQLARGMGGNGGAAPSTGTSAPAGGGGLDALVKGLTEAMSGGAPSQAPSQASSRAPSSEPSGGSFADVLNQSFQRQGEPQVSPTSQQDAAAGLMLRAMLQAAKCDGRIDEGEKQKILKALGNASPEEMAFVNRELSSPVDVQGLARQVPKGMENQIYAVSAMGIDLDSQEEASYLASLASALGMGAQQANAIHAQLGIPARFS